MLISFNLRGPLTAPTPIISIIRDATGLSTGALGLLTSIPVLCFGLFSPVASALVLRQGIDRAVVWSMLGATVGVAVRGIGTPVWMYVGSLVIGMTLTVGNVVALMIIRRDFTRSVGPVTGAYTAGLNIGTILTTTLTAPLAHAAGWRVSLGGWALLALAAALVWAWASRLRTEEPPATGPIAAGGEPVHWWRRPVVWALSTIMAVHLFVYYAITAWLPTILMTTLGYAEVQAGNASALTQVVSIATAMLATPLLRGGHPRAAVAGLAGCWVVTAVGYGVAPQLWVVWAVVGAIAQGGLFSAVFALIVLVSRSSRETASVSTAVQGIGYAVASLGPIVTGWTHDATGSWLVGMLVTALVGVVGVVATVWVRVPKR